MKNQFWKRHGSTLLTCLGGIGLVATAVTAVKATPKVLSLLEEAKEEKGEELSKWETVKTAAPSYIPAVTIGVTSLVCIFGANVLNKRQQASIASAYALIDNSYKKYRNKLVELYGEGTHKNVVDAIAIEKAKDTYIHAGNIFTDCTQFLEEDRSEPVLFYDEFGKRYFESSIEQVITAEYHLNRNYTQRGYSVLNEFYDFLGLEPIDGGDDLGWAIDDEGTYWIDFNHHKVVMDDGLEVYIIEMLYEPDLGWKNLYY